MSIELWQASGIPPGDIGVVGTAGSEFLNGVVGGVMGAFDALPCWPPRSHSHLDGDGGFALYECWVRLLAGEAEAALVCAFSRPLAADARSVLELQLDPYFVGPLHAGAASLAALQARILIDSGRASEDDLAARRQRPAPRMDAGGTDATALRGVAAAGPRLLDGGLGFGGSGPGHGETRKAILRPTGVDRRHRAPDRAPVSGCPGPVCIADDKRMAARLGLAGSRIDVVELHAPFSHQELILLDAIAAAEIDTRQPIGRGVASRSDHGHRPDPPRMGRRRRPAR